MKWEELTPGTRVQVNNTVLNTRFRGKVGYVIKKIIKSSGQDSAIIYFPDINEEDNKPIHPKHILEIKKIIESYTNMPDLSSIEGNWPGIVGYLDRNRCEENLHRYPGEAIMKQLANLVKSALEDIKNGIQI